MQTNPIDPIDGTHLLDELTKNMTNHQKGMITSILQGQNVLSKVTFKDAVNELDDLFDSK